MDALEDDPRRPVDRMPLPPRVKTPPQMRMSRDLDGVRSISLTAE